jgi:hypothetical protein
MNTWIFGFVLALALVPFSAWAQETPSPSPSPLPIRGVSVILESPGQRHFDRDVTHLERPPFARSFRAYKAGPLPSPSPSVGP